MQRALKYVQILTWNSRIIHEGQRDSVGEIKTLDVGRVTLDYPGATDVITPVPLRGRQLDL